MALAIIHQNILIMARFITLHREILQKGLMMSVEVYVNVDQITYISPQPGSKYTFVGLPSGFVEATETPEEIMRIIRAQRGSSFRGE